MAGTNFSTTILVDNSPSEVYHAINNVRGWWSEEIEGITDKLNETWDYHYQDVHISKIKIIELQPDTKVVWEVLDNYFSFTKDKAEWKGDTIVFEISQVNGRTKLQFTQVGLTPENECYDICENAWQTYIQKSLFGLITTGTGEPNGKDKPRTENEKALSGADFTTTIFVNQSPGEVFNSINNVRGWWQGEITGNTYSEGEEFEYRMKDDHYSKQKIKELIPDKKVVWLVTDSKLKFKSHAEWTGTEMIFEIKEINNKTQLRFTHRGLIPTFECYGNCSWAWELLIQDSLYSLITTGKGLDVFG